MIEEVKKGLKNKNTLILFGVGAGIGIIFLAMNKNEDPIIYDSPYPKEDQTQQSLAAISQAIEQTKLDQADIIREMMDSQASANYAIVQAFQEVSGSLATQIEAMTKNMNQNSGNIYSQVESIIQSMIQQQAPQTQKPYYQQPLDPYRFQPNPDGYTSQPDRGFSDFSIGVAPGSPLDNSVNQTGYSNFRIDNSAFNTATDLETAVMSGQTSGIFHIVEHEGKTYNVDTKTGVAYKTW